MKPSEIVECGVYRGADGSEREVVEIERGKKKTLVSWNPTNQWAGTITTSRNAFARWAKERVR